MPLITCFCRSAPLSTAQHHFCLPLGISVCCPRLSEDRNGQRSLIDPRASGRFPTSTITPKFHVMIYEHVKSIKKHKVLGLFTEECIEALHRAENEAKNLTSAIRSVRLRVSVSAVYTVLSARITIFLYGLVPPCNVLCCPVPPCTVLCCPEKEDCSLQE